MRGRPIPRHADTALIGCAVQTLEPAGRVTVGQRAAGEPIRLLRPFQDVLPGGHGAIRDLVTAHVIPVLPRPDPSGTQVVSRWYEQVAPMGGRTVTSSKSTTNDAPLRAGWYADPESALDEHWWNGSQWTSHTRRADSGVGVTGTSDLPPLAWSTASGPLATVQHEEPVGTTSY